MLLVWLLIDNGLDRRQAKKHSGLALFPSYGLVGRNQMARSWDAPARVSFRRQEDVPESMLSSPSRQTSMTPIKWTSLKEINMTLFFFLFLGWNRQRETSQDDFYGIERCLVGIRKRCNSTKHVSIRNVNPSTHTPPFFLFPSLNSLCVLYCSYHTC